MYSYTVKSVTNCKTRINVVLICTQHFTEDFRRTMSQQSYNKLYLDLHTEQIHDVYDPTVDA